MPLILLSMQREGLNLTSLNYLFEKYLSPLMIYTFSGESHTWFLWTPSHCQLPDTDQEDTTEQMSYPPSHSSFNPQNQQVFFFILFFIKKLWVTLPGRLHRRGNIGKRNLNLPFIFSGIVHIRQEVSVTTLKSLQSWPLNCTMLEYSLSHEATSKNYLPAIKYLGKSTSVTTKDEATCLHFW